VAFRDANRQGAMGEAINQPAGRIYASHLPCLTTHWTHSGVSDPSGIECCTSLRNLGLLGAQMTDLPVLSGLSSVPRPYQQYTCALSGCRSARRHRGTLP